MPLLEIHGLSVDFGTPEHAVRVVDDVTLELDAEETLGLVGESGSGKTLTSLAILGMVPAAGRVTTRRLALDGRDLSSLDAKGWQQVRGTEVAMIFQDPMTSLNPFLSIGRQLTEGLEAHSLATGRKARTQAARALGEVGIPAPETALRRFPHELSGGMRQRVMIAMALLLQPKLILADEPTTALDVTLQAQVLELLANLQHQRGTALLLVTHDLGVVAGRCDRVAVMYAGRLVETASIAPFFEDPRHPYSRGLLASVPRLAGPLDQPLVGIPGSPPDPAQRPTGCAFHPRCELALDTCRAERPPLVAQAEGRLVACPPSASLAAPGKPRGGGA